MTVEVREGVAVPASAEVESAKPAASPGKQAELRDRAKSEPAVQNVLDILGGDIEDVEEIS